jgi:hypothetical protein
LQDIAANKPKMPVNACANDNWVGRERQHVREASRATKVLASLGRCCWKQVRLGRHGDPATQEKALIGNTILFAQPTADVPSLQLPPPVDALLDSLNVIYTRSVHDLRKAEWATVSRSEYMRIVKERKLVCPVFAHAVIDEALAATRLPVNGVPEHILHCAQEVEGAENAPVRLDGPASRAPEISRNEEAAEESDSDPEEADAIQNAAAEAHFEVEEASIAVDPVHDANPVKLMQALQANLSALQQVFIYVSPVAAAAVSRRQRRRQRQR